MIGLPDLKKFEDMFSSFHTLHEHDRETEAMPWHRLHYA